MENARRLVTPAVLAFDEAMRLVRERGAPLEEEDVALDDAYGRVLAQPVRAPHPVPPFDNSVVDGYALLAADVDGASPERPVELEVLGEIAAGKAPEVELRSGTAVRIMTGAPVPPSADAIVMLEWTEWTGSRVRVERPSSPGRFIRRAGEDMEVGDLVLEPGRTLSGAEVGVLASLGLARVGVHRRPRVAILATGDELLSVEEKLVPGKIRSSNNYSLAGQVREAGAVPVPLGIARDDVEDLARRIRAGCETDVLLTSGGVSVGDHDEVQDVLGSEGFERIFWRVASSPGKPLLFGTLEGTFVFGLPGNPVSSMVAFENFVRPFLRRLQGDSSPERSRVVARLHDAVSGPESRRHFARVRVSYGAEGYVVREVRPHGSGNLRSMVNANGLAIVPEGVARLEAGESVEVVLIGKPDSER